jgi:hypothetical protein
MPSSIGDARWLLAQQVEQGTPKAFLALLVFWLALLFSSSFRSSKLYISGYPDALRGGCGRRDWDGP